MSSVINPVSTKPQFDWLSRLGRTLENCLQQQATYSFHDRWMVHSEIETVAGFLANPENLPTWWPQFQLAQQTDSQLSGYLGRQFNVVVRGFLPYKLKLEFQVDSVSFPEQFSVVIGGDVVGRGTGKLSRVNGAIQIDFTLDLTLERTSLRWMSLLLRPLMALQHQFVMASGGVALAKALKRGSSLPMIFNANRELVQSC